MSKSARAVILGGSIGGLCTARVLSEVCEEVVVLERDQPPETVENRPGVPQGRHLHLITPKGIGALTALFPSFPERAERLGGETLHWGPDTALYTAPFGWIPRLESIGTTLLASRPLVELAVREACKEIPNIRFVERAEATGIELDGGRARALRYRTRDEAAESTCEGALVVDASGRQSKVLAWLAESGIKPPASERIDMLSGYATQIFKAPPRSERPAAWWWRFLRLDYRLVDEKIGAILMEIEDGHWLVTLAGVAENYPPTDPAGFMRTVASLPSPLLAEMLRRAEPVTKVFGSRATENVITHYARWRDAPAHFIAVGDTGCRTNPAHGLGITQAAWSAILMQNLLKKVAWDAPAFAPAFFRAQASVHAQIWQYTSLIDLQRPETIGERPAMMKWVKPYVDRFAALAHGHRPRLAEALLGQGLQLDSPARLFSPYAIGQVLGTIFTGMPAPTNDPYPPAV